MVTNEYWAGLFDGEGWFSISRAKGSHYRMKRDWAYQCHASLCIREKHVVEEMVKVFGGTIYHRKPKKENHSDAYEWKVVGKNCLNFIEQVSPYLILKKNQALIVKSLQNLKNLSGNKPLTDEQYNIYTDHFEQLKKLNLKGIGK